MKKYFLFNLILVLSFSQTTICGGEKGIKIKQIACGSKSDFYKVNFVETRNGVLLERTFSNVSREGVLKLIKCDQELNSK